MLHQPAPQTPAVLPCLQAGEEREHSPSGQRQSTDQGHTATLVSHFRLPRQGREGKQFVCREASFVCMKEPCGPSILPAKQGCHFSVMWWIPDYLQALSPEAAGVPCPYCWGALKRKLSAGTLPAAWRPQPCSTQMDTSWHGWYSLRPYSCSSTCGDMMTPSCCEWHCLPLCSILSRAQCSPQPQPAQRGGSGVLECRQFSEDCIQTKFLWSCLSSQSSSSYSAHLAEMCPDGAVQLPPKAHLLWGDSW